MATEPQAAALSAPADGKPPKPRARMAATVGLAIAALALLGFVLDWASASPALCVSCHEMELRGDEWSESGHASVPCVECHQSPRPWYAMPARLVDRGGIIVRDVSAHFAGGYIADVDAPAPGGNPISDAVCLQCHDPNRKATSGYRILIDHVEHARRNGSCVSCHVRTAHPVETRGRALTFMAQCFTCHGTDASPEASARCQTCHPADYELVPPTHEAAAWAAKHGETARSDFGLCEMCHTAAFCTDCHGVEMPHPDGWERGAEGHAVVAKTNRQVCARCHGEQLDMCTMCHHTGYQPARGTWVKQHFEQVREQGASWCMKECHTPVFCIRCHASDGPVP